MHNNSATRNLLLLGYTLLLVYGTWFPLDDWNWSEGGVEAFLAMEWTRRAPLTDILLNLFVYLPFGFFAVDCLRLQRQFAVIAATGAGFLLSAMLELGQTYLPGRVTSGTDIALNTLGSFAGAAVAGLLPHIDLVRRLRQAVWAGMRDKRAGRLGLFALTLWALSQWTPFIPSMDLGNLRAGLAPLAAALLGDSTVDQQRFYQYLLMLAGMTCVALAVFIPDRTRLSWIVTGLAVVLAGKILIVSRSLSLEAVLSAGIALLCLIALQKLSSNALKLMAMGLLLSYHAYRSLQPAELDQALHSFNWIPFLGHLNGVQGLFTLLDVVWVFAAIAYSLTTTLFGRGVWRLLVIACVMVCVVAIELGQQYIPGRYPDVTDIVVAVSCIVMARRWHWGIEIPDEDRAAPPQVRNVSGIGVGLLVLLALVAIATTVKLTAPGELVIQSQKYTLPAPGELPAPSLPRFNVTHPRLPAPTPSDVAVISRDNPAYWETHRRKAKKDALYSRILLALVEPGSVDLGQLHDDLLQGRGGAGGDQRSLLLAMGYDWLHAGWSAQQRSDLLQHIDRECQALIEAIADGQQLSPYSASLYTGSLQALMAMAIASHTDSGNEDCMRFAADYWQNRVLPVWRQVMGSSGGWHEGGESLSFGLGQALYSLPAMWRKATGEDLFQTEPGLRGMLEFELFRTRPDGRQMRWGDASAFLRPSQELAALAREFGHAGAYNLAKPPRRPRPLAFPWGPISGDLAAEIAGSPDNYKYFDGIGMLIGRSDWTESATWFAFKAGDNYWSNTHLDQGAFTIYKGGPLAIDSGQPGSKDAHHRLNYAVQSIAHNVVTVTDPAELGPGARPAPAVRIDQVANDGGQRRVGSGWGRPAPLDLMDWSLQANHYETVGRSLQGIHRDLVWKTAELTPAYTSYDSGVDLFTERGDRVSNYLRSFAYLPGEDLFVVHDRLELRNADFRTRWLLHSLNEPRITGNVFAVSLPPDHERGWPGGSLEAQLIIPGNALVTSVGGPGSEYLVAGSNYPADASSERGKANSHEIEGGAWRVEIDHPRDSRYKEFLVVLKASGTGAGQPSPRIELTRESGQRRLVIHGKQTKILILPLALEPISLQAAR